MPWKIIPKSFLHFEADDHVKIDVDSLASSLRRSMPTNFSFSKKSCIFKIPNILCRQKPEAFVPNAFSIGPWHHGREHLKQAEEIKLNYLRRLISRFPERMLNELIQAIGGIEEDVRAHYAEPIEMSVEDFVKLLVIDGCFIIELFRRYFKNPSCDECDPIFHMSCMIEYLSHDLILLENQIPWSVLEILFNMTMEPGSPLLEHLGIMFFFNIFSSTPQLLNSYRGKKHILDLLREWLVSSSSNTNQGEEGWKHMPSAQSLKEAGVKFKKGNSMSILDVKFVDGVLEVPSLLVDETTEVIFRNLISFEQCYSECPARITSYAILVDNLINTEKDLKILCETWIIDSWLTPDDATQFFNKLYYDTCLKEYYYPNLCMEVNKYCHRRWPRWRAAYMHNYFGTPWAIASQVVAAVILILTLLQTLFSIIK